MRIEKTVKIARAVGEVWEFVADARNDPQWCEKVVSVEQLAGDGPGREARYRVMHRPRPFKPAVELTMDVVEFDPPHRLRWREEDEDAVFNVLYDLEPAASGTRLNQVDDIDWKIKKAALPIARLMASRDIGRQFRSLKRLLESG
ncbi:MAG: SRPBCC family protein [Thermoleophilaceae bacterium]|nr:SRPBCC family protein [Thermoleophilaceae bacterium]